MGIPCPMSPYVAMQLYAITSNTRPYQETLHGPLRSCCRPYMALPGHMQSYVAQCNSIPYQALPKTLHGHIRFYQRPFIALPVLQSHMWPYAALCHTQHYMVLSGPTKDPTWPYQAIQSYMWPLFGQSYKVLPDVIMHYMAVSGFTRGPTWPYQAL